MNELSPLLLSRIQFGFVISFHIIFPAFTIGLAHWLAFLGGMYLKTRNHLWRELYLFWVKIFAVSFGMGVVSGIVMSFQFGTNWSELSRRAGSILGPLLSYEVLTAFFLEATFLGVMLFGWKRVSPKLHFLATCTVALGTLISTFWITSANSWMHTPAGYEMVDGVFYPSSWWQIVFNPSFPYRLTHMVLAAFITTCFIIGGISAIYLLRGRHTEGALAMLKLAIGFALITVPLQIVAGDLHGLEVRKYQPAKLAAIEAHWETQRRAPLILFALPDQKAEENDYEIKVPLLGSIILAHEVNGEIIGLKAFAPQDRPPVAPVFFAFRVMVGIGILMLSLVLWSALRWKQGKLIQSKVLLRFWMLMTPTGVVAILAGWYTAEIGRQPYVIYGLMRTAEASSAVGAGSVLTSLIVFATVYLFIFTAGTYYIIKMLRKGPQPLDPAFGLRDQKSAARPLSLADHSRELP